MMRKYIAPALLAASLVAGAAAYATASYEVQVGYVDGLRTGQFFPSPWVGDTGVVSTDPFGCGNTGPDCGAIRIINLSGATLDITDLKFSINNSGLFDAGGLSIPAGDSGIFILNDSSDISFITGATYGNLALGCNGSGTNPNPADTCPKVFIDVSGSPTAEFDDSGHVLDTGGFDFASNGSNESFQWRKIGTFGGQSGQVPEPITLSLFGVGLGGLIAVRRRKRQSI
jgi:PEP-CTERM motif